MVELVLLKDNELMMEVTILGSKIIQRSNSETWVVESVSLGIMMEVNILEVKGHPEVKFGNLGGSYTNYLFT